ncbi:tRNA epoxyqueuosine(34) reductase QueG [Pigmentibacter sp. JX0631]|uniref:tRNA epoxyqueuosine(34) reductase QueG n=1 Tax=Pigmentibacter sp. JX0631 TaxID=2976982 RepID=UPI0024689696|nr:tRNA epoxyqueuosine(34) reductase QueG [Pigmentibacter sp. JX0631]WGL61233.1 tRNA epoxyqueuosine(34) reductase QueG [Pigmentibacter sp. JX0631]
MKLKKNIQDFLIEKNVLASSLFSFENENNNLAKDKEFFDFWLNSGAHAEMHFLQKNIQARKDPQLVLENCKTALIFLFPYSYGHRIRGKIEDENYHKSIVSKNNSIYSKKLISRYVYGKDYHKILKKNLTDIAKNLQLYLDLKFNFRPVIDSIPFFDRAHAREAGLGFIGKNTMLIRPGMGSFFFIATLLTDIPTKVLLDRGESKLNPILNLTCGDCTKCLDSCPTQALLPDFFLDAKRCLSYLTIEHRDIVPNEFLPHFKDTIYGCDICQEVCPYNFVTTGFPIIKEFSQVHAPFLMINVKEVALMDETQYEKWFGGTAATRAKYSGLVRNALYHLYATLDPDLSSVLGMLAKSENELILKTVRQLEGLIISRD